MNLDDTFLESIIIQEHIFSDAWMHDNFILFGVGGGGILFFVEEMIVSRDGVYADFNLFSLF